MRGCFAASLGLGGFNPVKVCPGSQVEGVAGGRGRSHEALSEGVCCQDFEGAARLEDGGRALLAKEIQPPIGVDRRTCVLAANVLRPYELSRRAFEDGNVSR